ncbi:MAG: RES family NAD+ phosphorylase [Sphingobium sp.]|nr:RES family NAD+ phosphorylase [Sphingomonadaceae bacterium]MCH4152794.1 RES family NAD+ phosphorylase [Sphingobium sp.]MCI1271844.1 RES family NAD+ phosphorylase [Sphingobium sp.]MCI1756199.1 RES family NAD+ phosphorylase [Sphingobium sp.]MCI2054210.1 RES family NAD+ phosphorylase [Sphingobium sp.]
MIPPITRLTRKDTHRLIPSRFPPTGILDVVALPEDLELIFELEGWSNDRIAAELGIIQMLPASEWVIGRPHATAIMAAYCHPNSEGGRFNDGELGAWYAAFDLDTAVAETSYHRAQELAEIGVFDATLQMRQYLADFDADFHDVRDDAPKTAPFYDPGSWAASQELGLRLRAAGSNGIAYRSVRKLGGECVACYRPPLVINVRPAGHFEFSWSGSPTPTVKELAT